MDESPLIIFPKLATMIGLNESIILQQVHYWNKINKNANNNLKDGYYWTFNSYEQWKEQFPFWSSKTIQRTISNLENMKLLKVGNYNKLKIDRTKWYRIDYDVLEILENSPFGHIDQINMTEWVNHVDKLTKAIPETNTKTNSENSVYITLPRDAPFLSYYNSLFERYMGKKHPKVRKSQLDYIYNCCEEIGNCIEDLSTIDDAMYEYFRDLPPSNNGNILAFFQACARVLEINLYNMAG